MEILFIPAAVVIGVAAMICHIYRSEAIVQNWAQANDYRVVNKQYCWFWKRPPFLRSNKVQTIYYVTVLAHGYERRGYVRWFWGVWSAQLDVMWEGE